MASYYAALTSKWGSEQDRDSLPPKHEKSYDSPSHLYAQTSPILSEKAPAQSSTPWSYLLKSTLDILKPSIFTASPKKKLSGTSYLDGLRGFAAFMVYWQHHQVWARVGISANHIFENGFGYEGRYYFACFPVIRTFFTGGHFAVAVFFVISGRVLSAKPLSLIHSGDIERLGDVVGSALFRRWLRLYIPCILTTFLYFTSWHLFSIWTAYPEHKSSWWEEAVHWYVEFKQFSFVFRMVGKDSVPWFSYNFHLWSIPVEFKGSVLVYTSLLALARCRRNARLWVQLGMIVYLIYIAEGACHLAMFAAGMLLSDLELLAAAGDLPEIFAKLQPHKKTLIYAAIAVSLYLSGVPSYDPTLAVLRNTPGWHYLSYLFPSSAKDYKFFYLFFASSLLVFVVPRLFFLKHFFETRFCQYLGRISFALYLVHGPVLWTLADRLYLAVGWTRENNVEGLKSWMNVFPMSKAGPLGFEVAFWVPHLVILPVTLWIAEVVTRVCDENSIRIARWCYRRVLPS